MSGRVADDKHSQGESVPSLGTERAPRLSSREYDIPGAARQDQKKIVLITIPGRRNSEQNEKDVTHELIASSVTGILKSRQDAGYSIRHISVGYDDRAPIKDQAAQIGAQLRSLDLPKDAEVMIVGASQGSYIGYRLAEQGKLTEGKHSLVAVSPPMLPLNPVLRPIIRIMDGITPNQGRFGRLTYPHVGNEISALQGKMADESAPAGFTLTRVDTAVHDPFHRSTSKKQSVLDQIPRDLETIRQKIDSVLAR